MQLKVNSYYYTRDRGIAHVISEKNGIYAAIVTYPDSMHRLTYNSTGQRNIEIISLLDLIEEIPFNGPEFKSIERKVSGYIWINGICDNCIDNIEHPFNLGHLFLGNNKALFETIYPNQIKAMQVVLDKNEAFLHNIKLYKLEAEISVELEEV